MLARVAVIAVVAVALLAFGGRAAAQATPTCTWPGDVPALWDLDEGTLTRDEVIPRIDAWLVSLDCDAETAPIRALLEGAQMVDDRVVYADAAVASARRDLAVHATLCAASWDRGELLDPLVVADACSWRGSDMVPFGAEWAPFAVVWSLHRRVRQIVLLEEDGDEVQIHAAHALAQLLSWYSDFDPTRGWHLVRSQDDAMQARLDEWRTSWPRERVEAVRRRADICALGADEWGDPLYEGVNTLRLFRSHGLDYEQVEELAFLLYLSIARQTLWWTDGRDAAAHCDEACREAWAEVAAAYAAEADRLCENVTVP